jgi:hypothetical protein
MKKRIISLFLVFCMTLSFIPAGALAAEADGVPNTTAERNAREYAIHRRKAE